MDMLLNDLKKQLWEKKGSGLLKATGAALLSGAASAREALLEAREANAQRAAQAAADNPSDGGILREVLFELMSDENKPESDDLFTCACTGMETSNAISEGDGLEGYGVYDNYTGLRIS